MPLAGQPRIIVDETPDPEPSFGVYKINVLQVIWMPVIETTETNPASIQIDPTDTNNNGTVASVRAFANTINGEFKDTMKEGSHDELAYRIMGRVELWEAVPLLSSIGESGPNVDYATIMTTVDITKWVNQKGVKEVWLHSYGRYRTDPLVNMTTSESQMGSKWGNTSNSDPQNLPICNTTYTMIFFNHSFPMLEAMHNYQHQFERLLHQAESLTMPGASFEEKLFWGKFCGMATPPQSNATGLVMKDGYYRCGWGHFTPNSTKAYEYDNMTPAPSDILDWKPEGGGTVTMVNKDSWAPGLSGYYATGRGWDIFWFKAIPRAGNTLTYKNQPLTDWWRFVGDWDGCMAGKVGLFIPAIVPAPAPTPTTPTTPTAPTIPSRNPCLDKIPAMPFPGAFPGSTTKAPILPITPTIPIINDEADPPKNYPEQLWEVKVLQLAYFPLTADGTKLDIKITGDVDKSLADMQSWVAQQSSRLVAALEQGCHRTINYRIMTRIEIHEAIPTTWGTEWRPQGYEVPLVDYRSIMKRFDITKWVNEGIKQVWIWGYHGDKVVLWESTMTSKWGNISNSDRNKNEVPAVGDKSYTVFNFNYSRDASMALESHGHTIEGILNWIDGRDTTPTSSWGELLFWGYFVGSDHSHRLNPRNGIYRCGWIHYCPNSVKDYDWFNPRVVVSDIGDWRPEGGGQTAQVSAATWSANDDGGMAWKIAWMKAIPRANNGLTFKGKSVTNWWEFIADLDGAMKAGRKLAG